MRQFFVKNIIFLILVNLIVKPVWIFGIDRNVQNVLGHEVYGQYAALLNFSIIFQILLDFGFQSYNSTAIAQTPKRIKSLFPNIIFAKGILSIIYLLVIFGIGLLLGYRGHALFLLFLLSFVQITSSYLLFLRSNISGMHHFKLDSLLSVSDRLIMILVCGALLIYPAWRAQFQIEWFIYAQIVSYVLTGSIAFMICRKFASLNLSQFNFKKAFIICKKSLPYATLIFLMAIYIRSDALLIERLLPNGEKEAGVYVAAYRLLDVANNVSGFLFASILLPLFGRMLIKKESVLSIVEVSINLLLPVAFTAVTVTYFFGSELMLLLYTHAQPNDGHLLFLLMLAFPGFCIGYVYSTLLTANGSLRALNILSLGMVVFSLGLNFVLIPRYGAWGAAITAAATQMILAFILIKLCQRILNLPFHSLWLFKHLLFIISIFAVSYLFQHYLPLSLFVQIFGIGFISVLFMLLLGFLPFHKIKAILMNKINNGQ